MSASAATSTSTSPRFGDWQFTFGGYLFQQGVQDYSALAAAAAAWYPTENLTLRLDLLPQYSDDWLLWEEDNLFGSYRAERLDFDFRAGLDSRAAPRAAREMAVDRHRCEPRQAYRTDAGGKLVRRRRSRSRRSRSTISGCRSAIATKSGRCPSCSWFMGAAAYDLLQ